MNTYGAASIDEKIIYQLVHGSNRAVKQLLDDGALVDGLPGLPFRPLTTAARFGRVELIKLLVSRGADLEICQQDDVWGDDPAGEILLGAESRPLHAAAFGDHVEAVRCLLELGADPNAADRQGMTALMVACGHSHRQERVSVVRELLKRGADVALANVIGRLALHEAALKGHTNVFALLLSAGPTTISVGDNDGSSVLAHAALKGHEEAVALLLSAGAKDKAAWVEKSMSSLVFAVKNGHEGIVRMFLDSRWIDAVGGLSVIPRAMNHAVQTKRSKILLMLLNVEGEEKQEHWANAAIQNITVLHIATVCRWFPALHMLLAAGADLTAQTLEGETPRDLIPCIIPGGEDEENDQDQEDAIQRALERLFERAPACRARSWTWPAGALTAVGVRPDLVVWRRQAAAAPLGVCIFRSTEGRCFSKRFARYSQR